MTKVKKGLLVAVLAGLAAGIGFTAHAQLFPYTSTSTSPSSSVVSVTTTASTTDDTGATGITSTDITNLDITSTPTIATTVPPLTTTSNTTANTTSATATTGTTGAVSTETTSTSGTGSTLGPIGPAYTTPATPVTPLINTLVPGNWIQFNGLIVGGTSGTITPATLTAANPSAVCVWYPTEDSTAGTTGTCPVASATSSYQISINPGATILLRDRTAGVLANITSGDEINVFGYYGNDGVIQASIVRDLSKPQVGIVPTTGTGIAGLTALFPNLSDLSNLNVADVSNLSATITQVNSDGSFVVQLSNGQSFTIPNFVHVGETVTFPQIASWINARLSALGMSGVTSTSMSTNPTTSTSITGPMIPYTGTTTTNSTTNDVDTGVTVPITSGTATTTY